MPRDGWRQWDLLVWVEAAHAVVFAAALGTQPGQAGLVGLSIAQTASSLGLVAAVGPVSRRRRHVAARTAWLLLLVVWFVALVLRKPGPSIVMGAAVVLLAVPTVFVAHWWWTTERRRDSTGTHDQLSHPAWPRADIVAVMAVVHVAGATAAVVDPHLLVVLRTSASGLVLASIVLPRSSRRWASAVQARLARGERPAAVRAARRGLALTLPGHAAAVVLMAVGAASAFGVAGSSRADVAPFLALGAWLLPIRVLGAGVRPVTLDPGSAACASAIFVAGSLVTGLVLFGGHRTLLPAAVVVEAWFVWNLILRRRPSHASDAAGRTRVAGPIIRGLLAGSAVAGGTTILLGAPTIVAGLGSAVALGCGVLLLRAEMLLVLAATRSRSTGPGRHALIVPSGRPTLLGGPRSSMEGWSESPIPVTVFTKAGSPAATYADQFGFEVEGVLSPDPRASGRLGRLPLAIRWLLIDGPKLVCFETVEVESNHLLEIAPCSWWFDVPLIVSVRGFPQRPPRTRPRRWLYAYPDAVYCINAGIQRWLRDEAGRPDARDVRIPVLNASPRFELQDAPPRRTLVMVGELRPEKGQAAFIHDVLPTLLDWQLVLIGGPGRDRPYVEQLEQAAAERPGAVVLRGQQECWTRAFDGRFVLVINSEREGGPRVAIEALAAGVPVVMGAFPGSETFRDVPFVRIVQRFQSWGPALESAHDAVLDAASAAGLRTFLQRYHRDAVGHRLTELWWRANRANSSHGDDGYDHGAST